MATEQRPNCKQLISGQIGFGWRLYGIYAHYLCLMTNKYRCVTNSWLLLRLLFICGIIYARYLCPRGQTSIDVYISFSLNYDYNLSWFFSWWACRSNLRLLSHCKIKAFHIRGLHSIDSSIFWGSQCYIANASIYLVHNNMWSLFKLNKC